MGRNGTNRDMKGKSEVREKRDGHFAEVTALLPLPKLQFLASAGLDRKIILWDLLENTPKREYKGYHKKGIVALDFSEALILLISGGFDHEIYVWNPYIDAPVHNLSGHVAPIVGLAFVPNPLHIISVDSDCIMKVWDTKKFKCVDSTSVENMEDKKSFRIQGISIISNPLKVIMYGKNIYTYSYDKNNTMASADENVSLCARFVPGSLCLLTPVGNKVKLWNLLTGEIKKIFSDLSRTDISALVLDSKAKRFIMGDMDGNVGVYNVTNGALLKSLTKHKSEIIGIIHAEPKNDNGIDMIISASIDNNIKIHDDRELGESKLLAQYNPKDTNIISMVYERSIGKLFIAGSNGIIKLYETATGKGNEEFSDKNPATGPEAEITAIAIFTDFPKHKRTGDSPTSDLKQDQTGSSNPVSLHALAYANTAGMLKFVAIPPLQIKHEILFTMPSVSHDAKSKTTTQSSITHLKYCSVTQRLFATDDKFFLKCYDIKGVISHIREMEELDKAKRNFKIKPEMIKLVFCHRVHDESINSLEYIPDECLLVTTSMDKNVKIFSSDTGMRQASLEQNKVSNKIRPIAYKKVESNEIYTPRMEDRIDGPFVVAKERRERRILEHKHILDQGNTPEFKIPDEIIIEGAEPVTEAFKEYELQEFDPEYYTKGRISKKHIEGARSNDWNLRIDFVKYYRLFEQEIGKISKEVYDLEMDLLRQKEEEEMNPKMFKSLKVDLTKVRPGDHTRPRNLVSMKDKFISQTDKEDAKLKVQIENEGKKKKRKANELAYDALYKEGLKHAVVRKIANERARVRVTEPVKLAAENFAKALSLYDGDDPRVLRFSEYDVLPPRTLKLPPLKKKPAPTK